VSIEDGRPKLPIVEVLDIVRALHERPMTEQQLLRHIGTARSTFFRLRNLMREHLGVDLQHDPETGAYSIADYGLLNRRRL
jgi:DNA-binding IclR family transcriptional regulator